MLKYLAKRARMVEREIDRWMPADVSPEELARASRHLIEAGGKRLRPCLVLTACEAVGGRAEDAIEAAAAVEMLHNFTLIHDDIMDRDEFRRNVKTVHAVWGEPMAIIAGDALFARVFSAVAENARRLGLGGKEVAEALTTVSEASFEVCRGQAMDMLFEKRGEVSEEEYMAMVRGKTGALTCASTKLGALLGRGSRSQVAALSEYGRLIGMAFQIQDDVLGLLGKEEKFGKPIGSDLREGKKTLILIRALSTAGGRDREAIMRVLGNRNAKKSEIAAAINALRRTGAVDYASRKAAGLVGRAKARLKALPDSVPKRALLGIADFVISREF
ncbi:MAG: polyprenyl synthetase family protein [Candidatus Hadarchaeales archaeon]